MGSSFHHRCFGRCLERGEALVEIHVTTFICAQAGLEDEKK